MDFRVDCPCGSHLTVTEGSAGATVECRCGRPLAVPPLKQLRLRAGLPAYDLSPELVLEHHLAAGGLPADSHCVQCGVSTHEALHVVVECEKAIRKGGFSWAAFLLSALFSPLAAIAHVVLPIEEEVQHGSDKYYTLPLALCEHCLKTFRTRSGLKQCLRRIPVYARLLEKFPDAKVHLANP
jgi:hypothetical protein